MSTLITAGVLLVVAVWALTTYGRLLRLRREVRRRWRDVHALRKRQRELTSSSDAAGIDREASAEAARAVQQAERIYNLVSARYNEAISSLPGNLFAGIAGFKRADSIDATRA